MRKPDRKKEDGAMTEEEKDARKAFFYRLRKFGLSPRKIKKRYKLARMRYWIEYDPIEEKKYQLRLLPSNW